MDQLMRNAGQLFAGPYAGLFAGYFTGLLLLLAGVTKLTGGERFAEAVRAYRLVPEPLVGGVARALTWAEILAGAGLLTGFLQGWAARAAVCLFLLFAAAVSINLLRGRRFISCGCFGAGKGTRLSWGLVGRNVLLGVLALKAAPALPASDSLPQISNAEMGFTLFAASAAIACWWLSTVILEVRRMPNPLDALERSHRHH